MSTVKELQKLALDNNLVGFSKLRKNDLISFINSNLDYNIEYDKSKNKCEWLMSIRLGNCDKPCIGLYCAIHNQQNKLCINKTVPCKMCGRGVYNKLQICKPCGYVNCYQIFRKDKTRWYQEVQS